MDKLKLVVFMLLNGEEVVIEDDMNRHFTVKLETIDEHIDFAGDCTYLIRANRLKD